MYFEGVGDMGMDGFGVWYGMYKTGLEYPTSNKTERINTKDSSFSQHSARTAYSMSVVYY